MFCQVWGSNRKINTKIHHYTNEDVGGNCETSTGSIISLVIDGRSWWVAGRKGLLLLILLVMVDPAIVISHQAVVMTDGSSV